MDLSVNLQSFSHVQQDYTLTFSLFLWNPPPGIHLFKFNNESSRIMYEICSKLAIKTPERHHWFRFGVFVVNFEQISRFMLMFSFLNLNKQIIDGTLPFSKLYIVFVHFNGFRSNESVTFLIGTIGWAREAKTG